MDLLEMIINTQDEPTAEMLYSFVEKHLHGYPNDFMQFHLDWAVKSEHYEIAAMLRDEISRRDKEKISIPVLKS